MLLQTEDLESGHLVFPARTAVISPFAVMKGLVFATRERLGAWGGPRTKLSLHVSASQVPQVRQVRKGKG